MLNSKRSRVLRESRDIAELTRSNVENSWRLVEENQSRFVPSDALKELTKADVENFGRRP
jgi:hypothetical protein